MGVREWAGRKRSCSFSKRTEGRHMLKTGGERGGGAGGKKNGVLREGRRRRRRRAGGVRAKVAQECSSGLHGREGRG